mgnify:CR=1 FL=1
MNKNWVEWKVFSNEDGDCSPLIASSIDRASLADVFDSFVLESKALKECEFLKLRKATLYIHDYSKENKENEDKFFLCIDLGFFFDLFENGSVVTTSTTNIEGTFNLFLFGVDSFAKALSFICFGKKLTSYEIASAGYRVSATKNIESGRLKIEPDEKRNAFVLRISPDYDFDFSFFGMEQDLNLLYEKLF